MILELIFLAILGCTAFWDIKYRKIPNHLIMLIFIIGLTNMFLTKVFLTNIVGLVFPSSVLLFFKVVMTFANGETKAAAYTVKLNGNNANLDGKYTFGADHYLAGYTLVYDIKGNGSNIKDFKLIRN